MSSPAPPTARAPGRSGAALGKAWVWFLALLVTGPVLVSRGFALVGDMVFVPEQPWKGAWLGLDGSVPRAVPSDALVSLATQVVPGDILQKLVLVALLAGAGIGILRMTDDVRPLARAAACTLYVWNPFVYERLAIGHWALLCGYAALPWVVVVARRLRDGDPGALPLLVLPVAVAAWTSPTGGLLVSLTVLAVLLGGARPRALVGGLLVCVVLNLPWLLPGVMNAADQLTADPFGVRAFAARADTPWGTFGSLLSFGGMWKESVDPPARDALLLSGIGLALTGCGVVGLWLGRRRDPRTTASLGVLGLLGLVLAWLPTQGPGADLVEWMVSEVPGAGILRDSQKWVALFALATCWGLARTADEVLTRVPANGVLLVAALVVLPVLAMPALAWGLLGTLQPVRYPSEWDTVRAAMTEWDTGRTVVLPFGIYRRFEWNDDRALLDPAPRYFPGQVVTDDSLEVDDGTVAGESRTAARIAAAVDDPAALARVLREEEIRWLLLEKGTPGAEDVPAVDGAVVHDGPELQLIDLGNPGAQETAPPASLILVMDIVVFGASLVVFGWLILRRKYVYTR
ncbi:MAG: hypothetical protein ACXWXO_08730 [Nocardioides sp.]